MPEPVALVTVIQLTVLTALHEQLVPVITDTALVEPVDGTDTLVGVTVALVHCAVAARASSVTSAATVTRRTRCLMAPTCHAAGAYRTPRAGRKNRPVLRDVGQKRVQNSVGELRDCLGYHGEP